LGFWGRLYINLPPFLLSFHLSLFIPIFLKLSGSFGISYLRGLFSFPVLFFSNSGDAMASYFESDNDDVGGAPPVLIPLKARYAANVKVADERLLRINYDIRSFFNLQFQDLLATRTINGGEVAIFERMLMASLWFPFLAIARELMVFLGVASM
jgi:hypothetical protein